MSTEEERVDVLAAFRQFFALERDVFVLSLAMFAFSLGFQMTSRYIPEYLAVLGASAGIVGLYGSFGNLVSAVYPYPGGTVSDRLGSRISLTAFGLASTLGFAFWLFAPTIGTVTLGRLSVPAWVWIFVGLVLAQAWKSFGLGATFAIVKQSVDPSRLATGFASTEVFRRIGFLVGPLIAAGLIAIATDFTIGFQWVLVLAVGFGLVATVAQHRLYRSEADSIGKHFEGLAQIRTDLRDLPGPLRPLLVGDTLVRFANGMVYVFFVIVITRFLAVDATILGHQFSPAAFFGILLGIEMVVALLVMVPAAKVARSVGLKPVVAAGFLVYATFPVLLITAPSNALIVGGLFAFSGLRFAGLPAHKALIVGPADAGASGRVTGSYYLVRNTLTIPSAAIGGLIYETSPEVAFGLASVIGVIGTAYFLVFGKEFAAYARS